MITCNNECFVGFPDDAYYPNMTCDYIITAPPGKGVIISASGGLANAGSKVNITFYAGIIIIQ